MSDSTSYAKTYPDERLPYCIKKHKSFTLRKLKDVDMWLQYNKVTNLQLAIKKLNGTIIKPGETFSLWHLVGKPSKMKGYKKGMVLDSGKVRSGYGGGLCQLGNLIYWMTIHTPLTVTERWRHSYDVFPDANRTLPFGSGATLSYNYIDLQIKNETKQNFQLILWLDETHLNGEYFSDEPLNKEYNVYEDFHQIKSHYWGGYTRHNRIMRKIVDIKTHEEQEELVTENHAIMMYEPFLEAGKNE